MDHQNLILCVIAYASMIAGLASNIQNRELTSSHPITRCIIYGLNISVDPRHGTSALSDPFPDQLDYISIYSDARKHPITLERYQRN